MYLLNGLIHTTARRHVIAVAVGALAYVVASGASAQSLEVQSYRVPSGPLARTLEAIGKTSQSPITYDPDQVKNLTSAAVEGSYTVKGAVDKALSGTGLSASVSKTGRLTVGDAATKESAKSAVSDSNENILPAVTVSSSSTSDAQSYVAESSSLLTGSGLSISQTPQSVQVVKRAVIDDQQAQRIDDVIRNVSGVSYQAGTSPAVDIRGFTVTNVSTDGLQDYLGARLSLPLAGVESVEVLKGPDAILSGSAAPGGALNINLKKPQAETIHQIGYQVGSFGDLQSSLDLGGAISEDKHWMYRFVVSGERAGQNWAGYKDLHNYYVAPSIRYKTDSTDIIVGLENSYVKQPITPYTIIAGGRISDVTRLENEHANSTTRYERAYYEFTKKLNDIFTLESKAQYVKSTLVANVDVIFPLYDEDGNYLPVDSSGEVYYRPEKIAAYTYTTTLTNDVKAAFNTGIVKHVASLGFRYREVRSNQYLAIGQSTIGSIYSPPTTDPQDDLIYSLSYAAPTQYDTSYFAQDQMQVTSRFHILGSMAWNHAWQKASDWQAWTPSLGLIYQLTPDVAVYANALRGFESQTETITATGLLAPPSRSKQIEVGTKINLLDDRVSVNAALYRISETNVVTEDANFNYSVSPSGDTHRGFELDVRGQVLPGLNLIGSYTFTNTVTTDSTLSVAPKHTFSLFGTYAFQSEQLRGFGVGMGFFVRSNYKLTNSYTTDGPYYAHGQVETDASVFYKTKKFTTTLGVKNIFDRRLYGTDGSTMYIPYETGRVFTLSGTFNF